MSMDMEQLAQWVLARPRRQWTARRVRELAQNALDVQEHHDHLQRELSAARRLHQQWLTRAVLTEAQVNQLRTLVDQRLGTGQAAGPEARQLAMDMLVALGVPRESVDREYGTVACEGGAGADWCPKHGQCTCPGRGLGVVDPDLTSMSCPLHKPDSTHPEHPYGEES